MDDNQRTWYQKGYQQAVKDMNRQPLSDKFIIDMSEQLGHTALETAMFLAGVRTAEHAHGIEVGVGK